MNKKKGFLKELLFCYFKCFNKIFKVIGFKADYGGICYELFLASINPSSAELNFPSTPVPLLGFHG